MFPGERAGSKKSADFSGNCAEFTRLPDGESRSGCQIELLKGALKRTYKERFEMAARLYKVQQTMNKATIVHKPFNSK